MPTESRPEYGTVTEKNVPAVMRDGTTLYADAYRPKADGRFPVILLRLPYGKALADVFGDHEYFPSRGYVVVVQDDRHPLRDRAPNRLPQPRAASTSCSPSF